MQMNIYIPDEQGKTFTQYCKERGINRSAVIQKMIAECIKQDIPIAKQAPPQSEKINIGCFISREQKQEFDKICEYYSFMQSSIIRSLVTEWIESHHIE